MVTLQDRREARDGLGPTILYCSPLRVRLSTLTVVELIHER